jgi:hypothetical protein
MHFAPDSPHPDDESTPSTSPDASARPISSEPEGAVPPGYDWPTHGGYLGCLLGLVAACLVGGFLGSTLFAALSADRIVPGWASAVLTVVVFVAVIVGLGRLGWWLGKRFYREYPQPSGRTWGEDDDYVAPGTEAGAGASGDSVSASAQPVAGEVSSGVQERGLPEH